MWSCLDVTIGVKLNSYLKMVTLFCGVSNLLRYAQVVLPSKKRWLLSSKIAQSKIFSNPHFLLQNLLVCYMVSSEWILSLSNSLYSLRSQSQGIDY